VGGTNTQTANKPLTVDRRVQLDVVVTDKSGKPVPDLTLQDFTLLDNKQPQTITSFKQLQSVTSTPSTPTEVVFVVDQANPLFSDLAYERKELAAFFKKTKTFAMPISIVLFTDTGVQIQQTPTKDGEALSAMLIQAGQGLREANPTSEDFYGMQRRDQISIKALGQIVMYEAKKPGRKLVIWLGLGWPILSGPSIERLLPQQKQDIFNSVASFTNVLRQGRITLYSVNPLANTQGISRRLTYDTQMAPITQMYQAQSGSLALQVLAEHSGGKVLDTSSDLGAMVSECMADANAYYTLSFDAKPAEKPNEYHSLLIKVDRAGVVARTNTGYYDQP